MYVTQPPCTAVEVRVGPCRSLDNGCWYGVENGVYRDEKGVRFGALQVYAFGLLGGMSVKGWEQEARIGILVEVSLARDTDS